MRIAFVLSCALILSGCVSPAASRDVDSSEPVRESCGSMPISKLKGSRSPREIIYRSCKQQAESTKANAATATDTDDKTR